MGLKCTWYPHEWHMWKNEFRPQAQEWEHTIIEPVGEAAMGFVVRKFTEKQVAAMTLAMDSGAVPSALFSHIQTNSVLKL